MTRQELQLERFLTELRQQVAGGVVSPKEIDLAVFGEAHEGGSGWVSAMVSEGREPGVGKFLAMCQFLPPTSAERFRALGGGAGVIQFGAGSGTLNPLASPIEQIALATEGLMSVCRLLRSVDSMRSLATIEVDEPLYLDAVPHFARVATAVETLGAVIDARLRACLDGRRGRRKARLAAPGSVAG